MTSPAQILAARAWHTALVQTGVRRWANQRRFGPDAPRPAHLFTVPTEAIVDRYLQSGNNNLRIGHWQTGQVLPGDWDLSTRPFSRSLKFTACRQHFLNSVPWDQTKAMEYGLTRISAQGKYDDCRTEADLAARYARLDDLWARSRAAGDLPPEAAAQTTPRTGILVHITRSGSLLFGNQGFHRLSIAKLANIPSITVVLGVVHPLALETAPYKAIWRP